MSSHLDLVGMSAAGGATREQRRNRVARILAALDLMSVHQIRSHAETAGIELPYTDDPKVLIEKIRLHLMEQTTPRGQQ